jgi:hypothetical protein
MPVGARSVRRAAWAGLQDSMPRAAVLSMHARVESTAPDAWADPALVQVWGPRFSVFAVAAEDRAVFTLGRLAGDPAAAKWATDTAERLAAFLGGREMKFGDAGRGMGVPHNSLRYGAATGRLLLRWDGARQPTVRVVPAPDVDPLDAGAELARRYLHIYGPTTAKSFAGWAGIRPRAPPPASTPSRQSSSPCARRSATRGSSPPTSRRSSRRRTSQRPPACCRAVTPTGSFRERPRAPRSGRGQPSAPLDATRVAGGTAGRRRDRRDVAARQRGRHHRPVAGAHHG